MRTIKNRQDEYLLQIAVSDYLKYKYPEILFRHDLGGLKVSIGQAKKIKRIQKEKGWPDLFIFEPKKGFYGFALELKKNKKSVYTKLNNLKDQHVKQQDKILKYLVSRGYSAMFGFGIDDCIEKIDNYLSNSHSSQGLKTL